MTKRKTKKTEAQLVQSDNDDWVYSFTEHRPIPITYPTIVKLIAKFKEFVKKDSVLRISQFLNQEDITDHDWYRWISKYPELKEAQDYALRIIGERREMGAITGKYRESAIMPYMSMWDKKFKEHAEWKASLTNKKDDETTAIKFVLMKDMPETDIVPKKKASE